MAFEICVWRGPCTNIGGAHEMYPQVPTRGIAVDVDGDVDEFLAWLAAMYPRLQARPWRMGWMQHFDADTPVTVDLFGGYAILKVGWPHAREVGETILAEARRRKLAAYLPFGPPTYGPLCLFDAADLPSSYWESLAAYAEDVMSEPVVVDSDRDVFPQ